MNVHRSNTQKMLSLQLIYILLMLLFIQLAQFKKVDHRRTDDHAKAEHSGRVESMQDTNYCNFKCGKAHIACNNTALAGTRCPSNVAVIHFDSAIKKDILKLHNKKRNEVAGGLFHNLPPAARMGSMQWDNELAQLARIKAQHCTNSTDQCHSTMKFENPGQNVALFEYYNDTEHYTLKSLVEKQIQDWFSKGTHLKRAHINKFHDEKDAPFLYPFALAIMDNNNHIGCGAVEFEINSKQTFHFVCNYAHELKAGDVIYKTGKSASGCTTGKTKKYKHLCTKKEQY